MTVNILGTPYQIIKRKYSEDSAMERRSICGYCDSYTHTIVYCDMTTYPNWENERQETVASSEKQTLRHEIVHAFFHESGLFDSSNPVESAWSENEEMVDWIALQGLKIYTAWIEAQAV